MKIDQHFEEYINNVERNNYHPELNKTYSKFPATIDKFRNVLFYGKSGAGKYSQMLWSIKSYSPSSLKYEKKMCITLQDKKKANYSIKISDIHYEVDMSLLGCNAKTMWNQIYYQICDAVKVKAGGYGIIVCKNFHEIHNELLDGFYNYMNDYTKIKFIIITEHLSFIPNNIVDSCRIVNVKSVVKNSTAINLKDANCRFEELIEPHVVVCGKILKTIINGGTDFLRFRENIYDLFILQYDVGECVWWLIKQLINGGHLTNEKVFELLKQQYVFLQLYNNNYRPIYHLENFFLRMGKMITC